MYVALPSSRVNSSALLVCRHDRVTREAWHVGLMGRDRGRMDIECLSHLSHRDRFPHNVIIQCINLLHFKCPFVDTRR